MPLNGNAALGAVIHKSGRFKLPPEGLLSAFLSFCLSFQLVGRVKLILMRALSCLSLALESVELNDSV